MSKALTPRGRSSIKQVLMEFGVHLVYSEGTKTEPLYVENIKELISKKYLCRPNDVTVINANDKSKSRSTTSLVKFAFSDVKKRLEKSERIDHVWIFFDKDDFPSEKFIAAHKSICKKNDSNHHNNDGFLYEKETGISWHSCWSNEAFELWLCLYFNRIESSLQRQQYIYHLEDQPSLKKKNFNYEKNIESIHTILTENGGSIDKAIKYAKDINEQNGINNPSTGVVGFAEYFRKYMDQ